MQGEAESRPRSASMVWLLLGAGLALSLLLVLGTWQVQRLAWKENLIATIEARLADAPRPLEEILAMHAAGEEVEYRPVTLVGEFAHEHEQYFLATHEGASGWHVYTPLRLADGAWIFVNRGFVPYDRRDPATRPQGQVTGEVRLSGLARTAPDAKPSRIVPDNESEARTYFWKDLRGMQAATSLDPVHPLFVDADAAPNPGGLPIGGVTRIDLPNNHLQYAVTWYGLALALIGVLGFWLVGQRRDGRT